ncbi:MAG: glycoside hydrolase family 78 protein [Anaerolineae bacterium]|nr:glycoside hydrolase family 78 protein [Anaerolineae bacterium]
MLVPNHLRCEYRRDPLGLDITAPRLSWTLESGDRGQTQRAYHVLVADSEADLAADRGTLWDSGRVESGQSAHVVYAGEPLQSGQRCWWKVRVWDQAGHTAGYSQPAVWQMGLLDPSDWQAQWISLPTDSDNEMGMRPAPYFRRVFAADRRVVRATLYAAAKGLYRLRLNGQSIGADVLTPDWTDYRQRIIYNTYDVTDLMQSGDNVLGAILGDGWYCGYVGFHGLRDHYGDRPHLLAQLHLELEGGSAVVVTTDERWKGATGPILYSDMLMGEAYDARRETPGWDSPGFDDAAWRPVSVAPNQDRLVAQSAETVQVVERLPVQAVTQPGGNVTVYDLGQNFAGWIRLRVRGQAGQRVQLHYGEVLHRDGTVYTRNLRKARAVDTYILKGEGEEVWEPHFTYHGFRYVELDAYPNTVQADMEAGCVVYSALTETGEFECSNPMVNQLWRNILWGQRGNFVSVPTDCPQRDERLGWLGDALAFGPTACYNMDAAAFFTRWLVNVEDAQSEAGAFPDVAPRLVALTDGAPGWGDAGVFIPWTLYQFYGDTRLIEQFYPAMMRWMDYLYEANPRCLRTERLNKNYGDWVSHTSDTPRDVLATALWAFDAHLMAEMAQVIGRAEDAERYAALCDTIKRAFNDAYVSADGRIQGDTQTCYALALQMDLLPEELRPLAARHLADDIERRDWHLSTGFLGTPFLLPALSEAGYAEVAYRLLTQDTVPSWGHMIRQGATTIWERWDGLRADGSLFDPAEPTFIHPVMGPVAGMNSFNHYGLGSVGAWLYRYVGGIQVNAAASDDQRIVIRPYPGGGLTYARASYEALYGPIESEWRLEDGQFRLTVSIPANTTATVYLPTVNRAEVWENGQPVEQVAEARVIGHEDGYTVLAVESGTYDFTCFAPSGRGPG